MSIVYERGTCAQVEQVIHTEVLRQRPARAPDHAGENQIAVASGANAAVDGPSVERALHELGAELVVLSLEATCHQYVSVLPDAGTVSVCSSDSLAPL